MPYWHAVFKLLDNPIEAWPKAVYEEPHYLRGDERQMFLYATDPAMLKDILLDRMAAFPKDWMFDRVTKPALGEGLLTAQGEDWKWQRRAAAPAFRPDNVAAMTPVMSAAAEAALSRWRDKGEGAPMAAMLGVAPEADYQDERVGDIRHSLAATAVGGTIGNYNSVTPKVSTTVQLLASGTGQTSRVDALRQAIAKAQSFGFDLKGSVMASDAFFPFPDCVEIASEAGITAVLQPGGSIKDADSVNMANEKGIAMVTTGVRHFKH